MLDTNLIQLISAAVASIAALTSIYFAVRTRSDTQTQKKVQVLSLQHRTDADLRKWAEEVSDRMTEAIFLCALDPKRLSEGEFFRKRHLLRTKLSALVDRGRWFLPNIPDGDYGMEKPVAYRGHRHQSLDCVIETFRIVSEFDCHDQTPNKKIQPELIKAKRDFVTEIQTILNPREREQETTKLIESVKATHTRARKHAAKPIQS